MLVYFFFFKQKTAYEMRISDWSSDVCSSDLVLRAEGLEGALAVGGLVHGRPGEADQGGVGQRAHQVVAQVAAGGAVRLVDQHEHVVAGGQVGVGLVELVDHGDDQAAELRLQQRMQVALDRERVVQGKGV